VARITIEDCLKRLPNRFVLVNTVAKRVRQIREGSEYLVNSPKNEDIVVALREIAAGKITLREEKPQDADFIEVPVDLPSAPVPLTPEEPPAP
jgi:DNA-directed RNA polymerase subunit omega